MIRVLHSVSNMDRAGIETMLMNYYRHIDRTKVQFDFLANKPKKGAYDEEIEKMGGRIFISPGLNPINWNKYQKMVCNLLKQNKEIKVVHSHNGAFSLQAQIAAKKSGIKNRIVHVHGTRIDFNLKLPLKLAYKTQLKKVSNNYWGCGTEAVQYYFGKDIIKNNNYLVIKNAIEEERFIFNQKIRDELREKYNLNDKFVIGNVARFMKQKNHTFILDLFKKVYDTNNKAVLMLIGDGELLEEMKKKAIDLNISNNVMFMGNIDNVNEMYQAMDLFLLPSLFEGLPVVGIEAQASGLKCIMSDTITNEVAITDNVEFVSLNSPIQKWVEAILDKENYERKNMKCAIVDTGYSIATEAKKLQEIYEKMGE